MKAQPTIGRPRGAFLGAFLLTASLLLVSGCAAGTTGDAEGSKSRHAQTPAPGVTSSAAGHTKALVTKLLVVVVENHSLGQMQRQMPFTAGLADRYAYADRYKAIQHPSLPNYLAILGGSTFGVGDDEPPPAHRITGPSIFGVGMTHGRTAGLYAEGMPSACASSDGGQRYAVRHNPWVYFFDERNQCRADDVALDALAGDAKAGRLPNAAMVIPDVCNDAHDCPPAAADRWLRAQLAVLTSGPDWTSGSLTIVITADEDDEHHGDSVLTVVMQRDLHHLVVHTPLTHYSLNRLYAEVLGVTPLREARAAPSMADAFGLRVRRP